MVLLESGEIGGGGGVVKGVSRDTGVVICVHETRYKFEGNEVMTLMNNML